MNTYVSPVEILIFGDFMACEVFGSQPWCYGISYLCRPDDHVGSIAAKFVHEVERQHPKQVVVFAGIQDAILGMHPDEYEFHILSMTTSAQEYRVPLTLITPLLSSDPVLERRLAAYRQRLHGFARQRKVYLFDLYQTLKEEVADFEGETLTKREYLRRYHADKIHLNKYGREDICQTIYVYFWGV